MNRKEFTNEKLFSRLLNNKSKKTYWDNIGELRSRPDKETFDTCVKLTKSNKPKEREIGIDILAQLGVSPKPYYKETIKLFFELLEKEKEPKVLTSLLIAIGHNNIAIGHNNEELNKPKVEKLISFRDHESNSVREGLVFSLLGLNNSKALDTLMYLSTDKIGSIRNWATFGIGTQTDRNNKAIRDVLWQRVNDKDEETKYEAIFGLAKRNDNRIKSVIKEELVKGDYTDLLFEAILELNDKEFLPLLKANLVKYGRVKETNSEWLNDLKNCLKKLKQAQ